MRMRVPAVLAALQLRCAPCLGSSANHPACCDREAPHANLTVPFPYVGEAMGESNHVTVGGKCQKKARTDLSSARAAQTLLRATRQLARVLQGLLDGLIGF